jgi:hypothetical protein
MHVIFERLDTMTFLQSTIRLNEKYGGGLKKSRINIRLLPEKHAVPKKASAELAFKGMCRSKDFSKDRNRKASVFYLHSNASRLGIYHVVRKLALHYLLRNRRTVELTLLESVANKVWDG